VTAAAPLTSMSRQVLLPAANLLPPVIEQHGRLLGHAPPYHRWRSCSLSRDGLLGLLATLLATLNPSYISTIHKAVPPGLAFPSSVGVPKKPSSGGVPEEPRNCQCQTHPFAHTQDGR